VRGCLEGEPDRALTHAAGSPRLKSRHYIGARRQRRENLLAQDAQPAVEIGSWSTPRAWTV